MASGAVVQNATVVVTNNGTGSSRTITTNSEGYYSATFLQPGIYEGNSWRRFFWQS